MKGAHAHFRRMASILGTFLIAAFMVGCPTTPQQATSDGAATDGVNVVGAAAGTYTIVGRSIDGAGTVQFVIRMGAADCFGTTGLFERYVFTVPNATGGGAHDLAGGLMAQHGLANDVQLESATSGAVSVDIAPSGVYSGVFEAAFPSGNTISGDFRSTLCP